MIYRRDGIRILKEHICCALSDKKGNVGVAKKKEWLKEQIANGLVFCKSELRGKVLLNIFQLNIHGVLFKQTIII